MYPCINRNARPNNNQLITNYLPVCYLLWIQQYSVNATYNTFVVTQAARCGSGKQPDWMVNATAFDDNSSDTTDQRLRDGVKKSQKTKKTKLNCL